ncbi:restriction endonuclease subunit S [Enterococcus faecium]|nr:restriction endonuclease subunit S [Enterococcus faecium]ROX48154.1 restriction endonuclease subunit S [Enterococcus faecium]ROX77863.1 restriction endonuclease subunit S [Enterococcus faecium]ROY28756.1 restriction endonuclease subunit S [Enterococcus faecium]
MKRGYKVRWRCLSMSNDTRPEIRFPGFTEDWEERKLGEVFQQTVEYIDPKEVGLELWSVTVENGLTPKSERYNREFLVKKNDKFKAIHPDEIVYNPMNMTLGSIGFNNSGKNVAVSGYYVTMKLNKGFDSKYFAAWLPSPNAINLYKLYATGSLIERQRVQFPTLSGIKTLMPILNEQKQIGLFFKQLDDTIALHQRKLDLLKETKKGFLQKMFPENGAKVPEIRFPGFTEAWEERKLGSIYDFSKGKGLPLNSFTYSKDDPAIAYGHLYTKYSEVISEVYLSSDDDGVLSKDNDLLFPGSSTVPNGTAQANAIMLNNVKLGGDIIIARPKQDTRVLSIFMSYQINSQRQKLFPITVGTTITHMYGKDLSKVKFFITNYSEQQKIGAFFKQLDDTIALHQRKLDLLKETKKGFLQKMFV